MWVAVYPQIAYVFAVNETLYKYGRFTPSFLCEIFRCSSDVIASVSGVRVTTPQYIPVIKEGLKRNVCSSQCGWSSPSLKCGKFKSFDNAADTLNRRHFKR